LLVSNDAKVVRGGDHRACPRPPVLGGAERGVGRDPVGQLVQCWQPGAPCGILANRFATRTLASMRSSVVMGFRSDIGSRTSVVGSWPSMAGYGPTWQDTA